MKLTSTQLRRIIKEEVEKFLSEDQELDEEDLEEDGMSGACWSGYEAYGMKRKGGRMVPNCVPKKKKG